MRRVAVWHGDVADVVATSRDDVIYNPSIGVT